MNTNLQSTLRCIGALSIAAISLCGTLVTADEVRRLPVAEYRDRMAAGWIGQMAGVGWGAPTEFKFKGAIIPEAKVPQWKPQMINQFNQDDIYVEMTFLRTMELHGLDCSIRQAGIDFANSGYRLWHANKAGRDNLSKGIAPPDSGHPQFNKHADDIDYQIEADFSGLIAPGLPNAVIEMGEKFGRLMNYGDGVYGGQFVGGMYAEAFFEDDPLKLVEAGLACVPAKCMFSTCIRDTIRWWKGNPDDWKKTWELIEDTTIISMRCGQDSDCNPSNAAGVLATTIGKSKLAPQYTSALNPDGVFSHTAYSFPALVEVCEKLARQAVVKHGGKIEKTAAGDIFVIPLSKPKPGKRQECWSPGPPANSKFTEAEIEQITAGKPKKP